MFTFWYLFGFWPAVAIFFIIWSLGKDADSRDEEKQDSTQRLVELYGESVLYRDSEY